MCADIVYLYLFKFIVEQPNKQYRSAFPSLNDNDNRQECFIKKMKNKTCISNNHSRPSLIASSMNLLEIFLFHLIGIGFFT